MNSKMKTSFLAFLSLSFVACGGGGSSESNINGSTTTYSISGTVPGTLIEAFCIDGSYYKTKSINNGTSNHPFELELPINLDCRLVMTTNETDPIISNHIITPIRINNGNTQSPYFKVSSNVDVGYINLPMNGSGIQNILEITHIDDNLKVITHKNDLLDRDNDGVPNAYEDDDNDGKYNKDDDDDDGDGIKDIDDLDNKDDIDGDGIINDYDYDDDNDGIEDSNDEDDDNDGIIDLDDKDFKNNTTTKVSLPTEFTENVGRLLGSQCAQCHGTNGKSTNSWDSIAGEDELIHEIHDEDPIMSAQAKGYTPTEISLIGNWLSTLQKEDN